MNKGYVESMAGLSMKELLTELRWVAEDPARYYEVSKTSARYDFAMLDHMIIVVYTHFEYELSGTMYSQIEVNNFKLAITTVEDWINKYVRFTYPTEYLNAFALLQTIKSSFIMRKPLTEEQIEYLAETLGRVRVEMHAAAADEEFKLLPTPRKRVMGPVLGTKSLHCK